jgi:hypothetical protein
METSELIESNEIIEQSCTEDQASAFEQLIESLEVEDYAALNDYLNAGVEPESDWHDYWDAFAKYEWREFGEAFKHVMGRNLSLD